MALYEILEDGTPRKVAGASSPKQTFLDAHPIGSYYITEETESPQDLYGGGWIQIQGKFLFGADGSTYNVGDVDGGEVEHLLKESEIPIHTHKAGYADRNWTLGYEGSSQQILINYNPYEQSNQALDTTSAGGNQPHNNMPPYHIVNIWKRIS